LNDKKAQFKNKNSNRNAHDNYFGKPSKNDDTDEGITIELINRKWIRNV